MKIYIYNNFYKNEFVAEEEREIPDGYKFCPPETNIAPPENEEGYCWCFDGESWSSKIEDHRGKKIYDINDSCHQEKIRFVGAINHAFTSVVPPSEKVSYKFDGTSWNIKLSKYKFSKYKLKIELQELNIWNDVWNSLTDDQKENLYLCQELDLNDNNFKSMYDYFKTKMPFIDDILKRCII